MPIDKESGLTEGMGITEEKIAYPEPRLPLNAPDNLPEGIREEVEPLYDWSRRIWGSVPRFLQMLAHAPVAVEAWMLLDQKLRIDRLKTEPGYVKLIQLVIVKTALVAQSDY
ncbi:MAG: hypothetical protein QF701_02575 [Nitrospinota bacterium]|jgi:hypothetical protein|nr:hypothetical protein [Nitrospinota bacterium]MDP7166635.1 hypothetical protein [Nitrospinota bacterium]MDP7371352.1 hypothetical protein [Nitrospinota bacterium]MDP7505155.1 hypothetical protein [Nitrospinota bacterium]MDP7664012.1 hypothetical protein [Nitrospinota bacterium]|tara:strand:+ start:202 stop:537 length:336 start_codon:yes stop_codon:yes gene_type:complete